MVAAAVIGATAAIGGGLIAAGGAKSAGKAQERAAQEANAAQERMFAEQNRLQEPFRQGGLTAQNEIMQLLGIGGDKAAAGYGSLGKAFGASDFQQDPGYAFRQSEGMKALERSAAARGNLLSGSTLKGVQRFGQDLASQEYQNAFNRYQVNRSNKLNPLQSLMGSGQSATNVMTSAAGQMRVEIQDADGTALPGFTLADCEPIWGDHIARTVGWKGAPDLTVFAGKPVRIRFEMSDADLFSIRFVPAH